MAKSFSHLRSIFNTFSRLSRGSKRIRKLQRITRTNLYKVVSDVDVSRNKHLSNASRRGIEQQSIRFRVPLPAFLITYFRSNPVETSMSVAGYMDPPEAVRGMTVLDKIKFQKVVQIPGIRVPLNEVGKLQKILSKSLLKVMRVKSIAELADDDTEKGRKKLFLFNPEKYPTYADLDTSHQAVLRESGLSASDFQKFSVDLTYDNWSVQDTLRAILPLHLDGVTGFSTIGHIAHVNLRAETFPYKYIIGEVILDKTMRIRTVVNKLDIIDNTFRNLNMELLAGEDNYMTQTKENGCVYEFDFSKVYWNPRLCTEHERIIKQLKRQDIVYDVFAGVGPFAIPAGKRGIIVHANDLNPASFSSLQKNIVLNKLKGAVVTAYNLDGRDFIKSVMKTGLIARLKSEDISENGEVHVLMNLPASAVEFLDCFVGLLNSSEISVSDIDGVKLPMVHCYCFSKGDNPNKDVQEQGETILGGPITSDVSVRFVRNVAPNKDMMCLSFRLTKDILFNSDVVKHLDELDLPEAKRLKTC